MLNIAVCDDESQITSMIEDMLEEIAIENNVDIDIDVFLGGNEFLKHLNSYSTYDIAFLDIEMKDLDGISTAKRIRDFDKNVIIIYVTSHENYMKETFEVRAFRFLTKPVTKEELETYFKEAYKEISNRDAYFRFKNNREECKVLARDILYFKSHLRTVYIVTEEKIYKFSKTLNLVEKIVHENLKIPFFRIHQSYLVNYNHIEKLSYDFITLDNGTKLPISENRRKQIGIAYCKVGECVDANE